MGTSDYEKRLEDLYKIAVLQGNVSLALEILDRLEGLKDEHTN